MRQEVHFSAELKVTSVINCDYREEHSLGEKILVLISITEIPPNSHLVV